MEVDWGHLCLQIITLAGLLVWLAEERRVERARQCRIHDLRNEIALLERQSTVLLGGSEGH